MEASLDRKGRGGAESAGLREVRITSRDIDFESSKKRASTSPI